MPDRLCRALENRLFLVMGESAGGTLVLSLALLLKEKGFSQPKRWCLSPPV
ncbi:MAG: steryl acetyl hydrolase [Clostridiales bacterium]|nr:steryl acetyl hydrolase [Clostridiales bacterium]